MFFSRLIHTLKSTRNYCKQYLPTEEWVLNKNNIFHIGLSKNATNQLGEIIYLEYQFNKEDIIKENEEIVILESVKATDSIKAPFDCVLIENNDNLEDDQESINKDPENTWIIKISKHQD